MKNAGTVELCPCIARTLRDRMRMVEALTGRATEKRALNYIPKGLLFHYQDENGELCLLHKCAYYPMYKIEIQLSLTGSSQLVCSTHYQAWRSRSDTTVVQVCPHHSWSNCPCHLSRLLFML